MHNNYDDIIDLPHPTSARHPRMSMLDRAAQFSPFAALTGYEDALEETARLTQTQTDPAEDSLEALDEKLRILTAHTAERPQISVTCFVPDARKAGGEYVTVAGALKKLDTYHLCLILMDGTSIPLQRIQEIDSPLFSRIR